MFMWVAEFSKRVTTDLTDMTSALVVDGKTNFVTNGLQIFVLSACAPCLFKVLMIDNSKFLLLLITFTVVIIISFADDGCLLTVGTQSYNFKGLICTPNVKCSVVNSHSGSCQNDPRIQMFVNCGQANQYIYPLTSGTSGGLLKYTNGTICKMGSIPRSTDIQMLCGAGPTVIKSVNEPTLCKYVIILTSSLACPNVVSTTSTTSNSGGNSISTTGSITTDKNIITTSGSITNQAISTTGSIGTSSGRISTSGSISTSTQQ
ncbi:hypothetical protein PPL_04118 [Heterostelium album PN500]|uniref:MRH domain-containing protein n=1 Tax=Heterostelium pallidum (strain ATCC 26659 / Pp 5 / PN500) TaxID=670386 RepID=D3B628_HETP5|nr:hypothetical protein PPL_04118 [Heterostelium album PN500]EFA83326.1 hypothetical protein PPL_04118 [Heterostelium album PN500]|eukprot:XP_020435443.1 hypothetical protein PPL_04118 [Heterostelium album PN500]